MGDIIINIGRFGKEDYDNNDIGIGIEVMCISNPNGNSFVESAIYHINGMGSLVSDNNGKYRIGFGKNSVSGYSLSRDIINIDPDKNYNYSYSVETVYISYDDLIRNFIYAMDQHDDPSLYNRCRRNVNINSVLNCSKLSVQ